MQLALEFHEMTHAILAISLESWKNLVLSLDMLQQLPPPPALLGFQSQRKKTIRYLQNTCHACLSCGGVSGWACQCAFSTACSEDRRANIL